MFRRSICNSADRIRKGDRRDAAPPPPPCEFTRDIRHGASYTDVQKITHRALQTQSGQPWVRHLQMADRYIRLSQAGDSARIPRLPDFAAYDDESARPLVSTVRKFRRSTPRWRNPIIGVGMLSRRPSFAQTYLDSPKNGPILSR